MLGWRNLAFFIFDFCGEIPPTYAYSCAVRESSVLYLLRSVVDNILFIILDRGLYYKKKKKKGKKPREWITDTYIYCINLTITLGGALYFIIRAGDRWIRVARCHFIWQCSRVQTFCVFRCRWMTLFIYAPDWMRKLVVCFVLWTKKTNKKTKDKYVSQ